MSGTSRRVVGRPEREIEAVLDPGRLASDQACFSFVGDLEDVAAEVATLLETMPAQAVELYEAFLAGCYEEGRGGRRLQRQIRHVPSPPWCAAGSRRARPRVRPLNRLPPGCWCGWTAIRTGVCYRLDKAGLAALVSRRRGGRRRVMPTRPCGCGAPRVMRVLEAKKSKYYDAAAAQCSMPSQSGMRSSSSVTGSSIPSCRHRSTTSDARSPA